MSKTYYGLTIDPLHIGAGGYRLGRVDNTIIREPGSNLPKVPGSSISGVCRNYAIYQLSEKDKPAALACAKHDDSRVKNNCGKCLICRVFGFANGVDKISRIGRLKFFDGRIVAFPVSTLAGPAWVTSSHILTELGVGDLPLPPKDELVVNFDLPPGASKLNLGWLYLPAKKATFGLPTSVTGEDKQMRSLGSRLVLAPDYLFSEVVNANLEVRTSVSIDFETGAAESGALFTYEAIPRATCIAFDVVIDTHRCNADCDAEEVAKVARKGFELFETLGLGGMNTRGFGRMKIVNL